MSLDAQFTPFSLTAVYYPKDDKFGKLWALISLSPIFIVFLVVVLFVVSRNAKVVAVLFGLIGNVAVNLVLKQLINQKRPHNQHHHLGDAGMPSNHSQFMWFLAGFFVTAFVARHVVHRNKNAVGEAIIAAGSVLAAALVSYSRVHLLYHSVEQVVVGAGVGAVLGTFWLLGFPSVVLPWTLALLDHPSVKSMLDLVFVRMQLASTIHDALFSSATKVD